MTQPTAPNLSGAPDRSHYHPHGYPSLAGTSSQGEGPRNVQDRKNEDHKEQRNHVDEKQEQKSSDRKAPGSASKELWNTICPFYP